MVRKALATTLVFLLGTSCLWAQDVATRVRKVDPEKNLIVVREGSRERPVYVTPGILFLDSKGDEIVPKIDPKPDKKAEREAITEALKELQKKGLKEGIRVTVVFDQIDKKTVIRELRFDLAKR
jgi:hypothetical protein